MFLSHFCSDYYDSVSKVFTMILDSSPHCELLFNIVIYRCSHELDLIDGAFDQTVSQDVFVNMAERYS